MTDFDPKILGGSVKRGIVNPDLLEERAKCNFDQDELKYYIFGTDLVTMVEKVSDYITTHPEMKSGIDYYEMTREEKFKVWWRRYRHIMESEEAHPWLTGNSKKPVDHFSWSYLLPGQSPLTLHHSMFNHSLDNFGTEEQRAHYLPQADHL